jgi:hypothetical protein
MVLPQPTIHSDSVRACTAGSGAALIYSADRGRLREERAWLVVKDWSSTIVSSTAATTSS